MKNILLILSVIILASCSSDDNSGDIQDQFENIKTIVPQGTWAVSNYTEGETNKTSNFESFVFTFNGNGTVVGANDLFSENGTWIMTIPQVHRKTSFYNLAPPLPSI